MARPNRLISEKSPYLRQHAHNPVDWRPWGEEAWAEAREADRPVFLSIGYSTCHWCHVMAHESFEHPATAELLNHTFVCIKVDREERPDLDAVYMAACQTFSGQGGWPLTVLLTPEGEPFFAGTYLPRESRFGRMGLVELTRKAARLWAEERERVRRSAGEVAGAVARIFAPARPAEVSDRAFARAREHFAGAFDPEYGGFGNAPKFPSPHQILFLLRAWQRDGDDDALHMATHTLRRMRQGGLCDQVGFGFHRYSTDGRWFLPHFEKMLYDQGLLLLAYAQAHQATADPLFARVCGEIATYLRRDLRQPGGAFAAAEDADSAGGEGRFYLWTLDELAQVLGPDEARFWTGPLGLTDVGNFAAEADGRATGANILHFPEPLPPQWEARWETTRQRLLAARGQRERPAKDDKILADWNGLAAAGLALAGRALDDAPMVADAAGTVDFVLAHLRREDGRLLHRWREDEAAGDGLADDYAFLAWGLMELFAATLDPARLDQARQLLDILLADFRDPAGGLCLTPAGGERLLARPREAFDGALPSANSVALLLLPRLFRLTGEGRYMQEAQAIARAFGAQVEATPAGHALFLCALDLARNPRLDVHLTGDPAVEPARGIRRELDRRFLPDLALNLAPPARGLAALGPAHQPAALLCRAGACFAGVDSAQELRRILDRD